MGKFSRLCFCCSSHLDRTNSPSFAPRGEMIYTKTPFGDSRKNDTSNRNGNSMLGKKHSYKERLKDSNGADNCSDFAANSAAEKNREDLSAMREQLEDLRQKVLDKDEFLKATEMSRNQMNYMQTQVDELKRHASEKDNMIQTSQQQLSDAKIKLADKQANLEKLRYKAKTSNQKVEWLQEELDSMQSHLSALMTIFEGLSKNDSVTPIEDFNFTPFYVDRLPDIDNNINETEMQKMEEATKDYLAAVALAKEKKDEKSLVAAAQARLHLQSFVFRDSDDY